MKLKERVGLNVKKESKNRNIEIIIAGIGLGLISAIYLSELFQYLVYSIFFGGTDLSITWSLFIPNFSFPEIQDFPMSLNYITSYLFIVLIVEMLVFYLKKSEVSKKRFLFIELILANLGVIVFAVIFAFIALNFSVEISNDILSFVYLYSDEFLGRVLTLILITFISVMYSGFVLKRVQSFIIMV